jgi:predicted RNA-binding Zn-ribbon protein involved in translation (DUF1610 family)
MRLKSEIECPSCTMGFQLGDPFFRTQHAVCPQCGLRHWTRSPDCDEGQTSAIAGISDLNDAATAWAKFKGKIMVAG